MFTVDDLETMPDDGKRYELIDGMLFVSPLPGRRHQQTLVDPQQPSIIVFELIDGRFAQVAEVVDTEMLEVEVPYPVRVTPRDLSSHSS